MPTQDANAALEVQEASLTLGGRRVLQPLSLRVNAGERLAIVGPNGAGKSSLLHLLAARLKPDAGRVLLFGQDIAQTPPQQRARHMAALHQDEIPSRHLSVSDYVALGRIPHGSDQARDVHAAIARFGLAALAGRRMDQLSGGQRRLAALARAVAQAPQVLLLDEPTNHLDLRTRIDVLDSVATLGITVVAVLHELSLAARFAQRVLVLHRGRAVALDTPDAAFNPELVRQVFRMNVYRAPTAGGAPALIFDAPADGRPFDVQEEGLP